MEGNFRSRQPWDSLPITPAPATDAEAAQRIELAVCALSLAHHVMLRGWYVERSRLERVCRHVQRISGRVIPFRGFDDAIKKAKQALLTQLELPDAIRKEKALARTLAVKRQLGISDTR